MKQFLVNLGRLLERTARMLLSGTTGFRPLTVETFKMSFDFRGPFGLVKLWVHRHLVHIVLLVVWI